MKKQGILTITGGNNGGSNNQYDELLKYVFDNNNEDIYGNTNTKSNNTDTFEPIDTNQNSANSAGGNTGENTMEGFGLTANNEGGITGLDEYNTFVFAPI